MNGVTLISWVSAKSSSSLASLIDTAYSAAPLATVDVAVDLPSSTTQPQQRPDKPVFLSVRSDLSLALGEEAVSRDALSSALAVATKNNKDERIFLRADKAVSYGEVMEVMNMLRNNGYLKVALVGLETRDAK